MARINPLDLAAHRKRRAARDHRYEVEICVRDAKLKRGD
jgi:hypothetical protein